MGEDSSPRCPESPLAPHQARCCVPLFGLVRRLPPAAVQRGRAQLALCVPGSPVQIGALSVSLAAWSLFAGTWCSGKVSPRGEARCSGASSSRILPENHSISRLSARAAAPFGESFDLRRLRPNDSPPVVSAARPPQARLVPLRFAGFSNLLSVLLRRPGEQITEARLSLRSNPFGGFSFFQVASLP